MSLNEQQVVIIYANLTAYSVITTFIARGEAEFNKFLNRNIYLQLD